MDVIMKKIKENKENDEKYIDSRLTIKNLPDRRQ